METSTRKSMISSSTSEGLDRISSLPDDILHKILSYLFILDVVQLSVLSKRWKYIWTTMPYLHFDLDTFFQENRKIWDLEACYLGNAQKIENFINWVLISQRATKLVRFLLCCGAIDGVFDKMAIFRWIHAATRRNVQQLVLEFSLDEPFELPYCLATCESLQVLKLHLSGNILKLPNHFGLRHLKLLHLEEVELSDEHLTSCLFSKCHLLETLILHECSLGDMTLLDITSTSLIYLTVATHCCNVKCYRDCEYVEVYGNCEVKISCPNLKFLKYKASMPKDMIIKNLLSIEDVCIVFTDTIRSIEDTGIVVHKMIKEFPSTSVLKLCKSSISGLYEATSKERLSPVSFYKLKSLKLEVGVDEGFMQVMILLLKYSPNLEGLKLCSDECGGWTENWQMHDPEESLVCLESHLKSIQLTGFKGEENEIELLRFFLKHARVLEKLMIVWEEGAYKSEEASERVLKFPRTSSLVVLTFHDANPETYYNCILMFLQPLLTHTYWPEINMDFIVTLPIPKGDEVVWVIVDKLNKTDHTALFELPYCLVQELVLGFRLGEPFELPYCLATCESLQVLKLHLYGDMLKLPNHLGFCQLKLLHLEQVELSDEHLTSCLFSKCHLLETLILEHCSVGAMTLLDIASTSLIYVILRNNISIVESFGNCEIKISCPSLKFLKYNAPVPKDLVVENLFSIEVVRINLVDRGSIEERGIMLHKMIKEIHHSTSFLKLCMTSISGLYHVVHSVRLSPVSFHKLKSLKLEVVIHEESMQVMILLLKYSPNMEVLKLWSDENGDWTENWQMHNPDESIVCLDSHLKSIQLIGFKEDENEIELVRFFLKNARVLEKLTIVWASYAQKSKEASEEISMFPRTSSHVVVTFLDAKPWPKPRTRKWYSSYEK